ncbi:MAG: hypothetical protein LUQ22_01120 [Methanotrichaceae archaeon]|nr:hypothetical protein [Methanotrichaceae archaeon]
MGDYVVKCVRCDDMLQPHDLSCRRDNAAQDILLIHAPGTQSPPRHVEIF